MRVGAEVETALLTTKLFVPPIAPGLVVRPRLMQRLGRALSSRLTLVSAPAGFGKTTLVSQWVHQTKPPVPTGWLSLEAAENDPARFWEYAIAALNTIEPAVGKTSLSLLHSSRPIPIESTLTALINDLSAVPEDFALVLDDYHFISNEAVHKAISFLLDHLPPKMHVVIGTRADPPLPLARFRGKGVMLEIGADELRFTLEEAAGLLRTILGPELTAEDAQAINTRAEGWAVGVKMAALSLGKQKDIKRSVISFTGGQRYIMDYLMEEVLRQQSADTKDFLLKTSVLDRLTPPLCDAVAGGGNGKDMLMSLEKANLFIVPLDEPREWYRYEHLFGDLLRLRLETELGKEAAADLHRMASKWYEANGLPEDAVNHALSARDWPRAMDLISVPEVNVPRWASLTMFNWLRRIPEELIRTHVPLYLNYFWALTSARELVAAGDCLKYLDSVAEHDSNLQGRIATARAWMAMFVGDSTRGEEYAKRALSLLPLADAAERVPNDVGDRGVASMILAENYLGQNLFLEAEPLLKDALDAFQRVGATRNTIRPLTLLGIIRSAQGNLNQAVELYQEAIETAKGDPVAAVPHLWLGDVYGEWNELKTAAFHQERAVEFFRLLRGPELETAYLHLARTRMAAGDDKAAMEALEDADRFLSEGKTLPYYRYYRARNAAFHAHVALLQGDGESASVWIDRLAESEASLPPDITTSALRLLFARKGTAVAQERWRMAYDSLAQQGRRGQLIGVRILQALDSSAAEEALEFLGEALAMGKPEGHIRVFVDCGTELSPLLRVAISRGTEPKYARKLLSIIEAENLDRLRASGREATPSVPLPEPLSKRELEVLELLVAGASNKQVADRLTISLGTVKTHVHHILDKLGTENRTLAIVKARELKLI